MDDEIPPLWGYKEKGQRKLPQSWSKSFLGFVTTQRRAQSFILLAGAPEESRHVG